MPGSTVDEVCAIEVLRAKQPAYAADLTEATAVMDSARNAVRDLPSSPTHGITSRPLTVTGCPSVSFGCSPATVTLMISPPSGPFTYNWTTHCSRPVVLSCRCAPVFRSTFGSGARDTSNTYADVSSTRRMILLLTDRLVTYLATVRLHRTDSDTYTACQDTSGRLRGATNVLRSPCAGE